MPVLSGFLPIPLAMMIPFMGAQSLVIGKQFGEGFQYGKRKISAMSNEDFNKLTPAILAQNSRNELNQMIPTMQASIQDMRSFQSFLIQELIATAKQLPSDIFSGFTGESSGNLATDALNYTAKQLDEIRKFATGQFVGYKPRDELVKTQDFTFPQPSGGPIGPQQPRLDSLYSSLTVIQLRKIRNSPNTWGNIPRAQRTLIQQIIDDAPKPKTTQQAINETSSGIVKQIASMFNYIKQLVTQWRQTGSVSQKDRLLRNQRLKKLLIAMKEYNRFVTLNRRPKMQIDTAETLRLQTIRIKK